MSTYRTIDYLPDLTSNEKSKAIPLTFSPYTPTVSGIDWDNKASYYTSESYAILRSTFEWKGTEGATYDIFSHSYFDPFLIEIYDSIGNVIAVDKSSPSDTYGTDYVWDFVAPYTGTYYVSAGWDQGNYDKFVSISIYEDIDTAKITPQKTNIISATLGNDKLISTVNNDYFDGLSGLDSVQYTGNRSNYLISQKITGITITDTLGALGTDTLTNIERLKFSDQCVALDVTKDGAHAGEVAKILGAVFGATAITNKELVGIGLYYRDNGVSYETLGTLAIGATGRTEFGEIVELLWSNVVRTQISADDKAYYVGLLEHGMSIGTLTALAADTGLNLTNIDIVGLATTGLAYTEFLG